MNDDILRPQCWDDFVGQAPMKAMLRKYINAANPVHGERRALEHIFLYGPSGMGKTTLARLIAKDLGDPYYELKVPRLTPAAFFQFWRKFRGGVVLFDEIHRLKDQMQEDLLGILESGEVTPANGRPFRIPWLTFIGATTDRAAIISTVLDRFDVRPTFTPYENDELALILLGQARRLGVHVSEETALALAPATGGVPRHCKDFVKAARALGSDCTAETILEFTGMDPDGLEPEQVSYLQVLSDQGGVAGLDTIKVMLGLHQTVVRDLERALLQKDYIAISPGRGRELVGKGWDKVRVDTTPCRKVG